MRIIAGNWRGRTIRAPKGEITRPTADRTRETLFSMLVSRLGSFDELRVLDLFAGTGALGLEALSRGAASCTFVEQDRDAVDCIRDNLRTMGGNGDIRDQSVLTLGPAPHAYDVVFIDPPYGSGAGGVALDKLARLGWFGAMSWISVETSAKETVDNKRYVVDATRKVGIAKLTLLRPAPAASAGSED